MTGPDLFVFCVILCMVAFVVSILVAAYAAGTLSKTHKVDTEIYIFIQLGNMALLLVYVLCVTLVVQEIDRGVAVGIGSVLSLLASVVVWWLNGRLRPKKRP